MSRFVASEHEITEWIVSISGDDNLEGRTKLLLVGIVHFLDRNRWSADVTQSWVVDHLHESRSTMSPYWAKAIESDYLATVGSHHYKAGSRTLMGPTVRLVLP